ncbi:5973_t:CDS:2 [Funneliformis geosporum]|uniref:3773_t:CDS:1 n=1 Tax=Funneliformis geosporum TaxID=1117311 RepID=A0A9W4SBZ1_9GLOM|nr:5973_t:CDS:2 [Funneliformis geosporum]CAI2163480.1 3773_t:CDS:2 [Funneliformis geosporum]
MDSLASQNSQIYSLQPPSFNKPIPYLPPEIITEIISCVNEDDIKSLYSIIQVNRTWFYCSIHILWRQPFKYISLTGYSKLLKIYIWFLPEQTKLRLQNNYFKFDVKEFNKKPIVNYLSFLENLEIESRSLYWAIKLLLPTLEIEEGNDEKPEDKKLEQEDVKGKELQVQAHALLIEFFNLFKENCPNLKNFKMPKEHLSLNAEDLENICTNLTDNKSIYHRPRTRRRRNAP